MSNYGGGGGGHRGGGGRGGSRGGRSNYRGGGGRSGGGRSNFRGGGRGGHGDNVASTAKFRPCKTWTTTGTCPNGNNCNFAHIVQLHGTVDASSVVQDNGATTNNNNHHHGNRGYQNQQQQRMAPVGSVAIWESQPGMIKIFTGSHDGFWRLWNTAGGNFAKEFESNMRGKVECLNVVNNFLFCGFEAVTRALPACAVGMVHAWNLQQPASPPLELQTQPQPPNTIPYAHNQAVTALCVDSTGAPKVVSGSRDGTIRIWEYRDGQHFVLVQSLPGHAREVTGLVLLPQPNPLLWSCSTDGSIRIWDLTKVAENACCQYCITRDTASTNPSQQPAAAAAQQQQIGQQQQQPSSGVGHTHAVTALLSFQTGGSAFILSSSLDGTIKVWAALTGECVASENHGEGVVTMSIAADAAGHQLLLIGLESGNIMCRNLTQQSPTGTPAFSLLFVLAARYSAAHDGAVKALAPGPSATFYSGGADGKLLVWQFTGDLGLK